MYKWWTIEEKQILHNLYHKGIKEVQELLPHRTYNSICQKASKLGISEKDSWSLEEDWIIEKYYPIENSPGVQKRLPHRTISAIYNRAHKLKINTVQGRSFKTTVIKPFGRWVSIEFDLEMSKLKGAAYYKCICIDENVKYVSRVNLTSINPTLSCGCLWKERVRKANSGKNSYWWKGENCVSPLKRRIYKSSKFNELRKARFELDNYVCQYSGETDIRLNIHHIRPMNTILKENKITTYEEAMACEELWNINNVVTLAEKYHLSSKKYPKAFHSIYGTKECTAENFKRWIAGDVTP